MSPTPERTGSGKPVRPFTLAIASGKGGTGKTLVATNLAVTAAAEGHVCVLADCDVEAPNDHIFLPVPEATTHEVGAVVAVVQQEYCTGCGAAKGVCSFGALRLMGRKAVIFEELCHGCGKCGWICPVGAIREETHRVGEIVAGGVSGRGSLKLATGRLDVGGVKAPNVIRAVREHAAKLEHDLLVLDAPPGVACASVAAIRGADAVLHVTEPTAFGTHDLDLSLELAHELGIPSAVLVNREGTGTADVSAVAGKWDAEIIASIPFERAIAETYARGDLMLRHEGVMSAIGAVVEWLIALQTESEQLVAGVAQ